MQLIDADEAIKRLGDAHLKNYGNAIMVIRETPTVEAIPVNWLTNLAKEYEESDNQYFRMDSCVIEDLIKIWKEEEKNG